MRKDRKSRGTKSPSTPEEFDRDFQRNGYLSEAIEASIPSIRNASRSWFSLANKTAKAVHQIVLKNLDEVNRAKPTTALQPKVLATFIALRAASMSQGALVLAERGMVVEARTLIRGLIESSFCIAALLDQPDKFIEMFQADDAASRKAQATFILAKKIVAEGSEQHEKLTDLIASIEKGVKQLPIKEVAELGVLTVQYLAYRVISNDSAHPSATSLKRHMNIQADGGAWTGFAIGPADSAELDATLQILVQTLIGIGVGYTQLLSDSEGNKRMAIISDELHALGQSAARLALSSS